MIDQALFDRLKIQQERLALLAERSDLIEIEAIDPSPGWPADKYLVTYRCKGIAGVDQNQEPEYSSFHQMEMRLSADYPVTEPYLKFLTPIWHPNISSTEPRQVCTDHTKSWWVGKDLDLLVLMVGEMVQYKSYHADWVAPFPKDLKAAQWVLEYAQPRKIVGRERPVDNSPLRRPYEISQGAPLAAPFVPPPAPPGRITLGKIPAIEAPKKIALGKPKG